MTRCLDDLLPLAASFCLLACLVACGSKDGEGEAGPEQVMVEVSGRYGLDVQQRMGLRPGARDMPAIVGSGCAVFDADGDGREDFYLIDGGTIGGEGFPNRMFFRRGDRFVQEECGLEDPGFGMGVAVGDLDNDGDLDLYLCNYGPDRLYLNDGKGRFTDATEGSGIEGSEWTSTAALFDWNGDGLLDVYVVNYVLYDEQKVCSNRQGRVEFCGPKAFPGCRDRFLLNLGGGRFRDVSEEVGIERATGRGLGVCVDDFNDDGRLDVYVANDGESNQMWISGPAGFTDAASSMGVATNGQGTPEASMGTAVGDVDGDGDPDILLTHLGMESNTLYLKEGDVYEDGTGRAGLTAASMALTGFGTAFGDLDHDGALELVVGNGRVTAGEVRPTAKGPLKEYAEPNQIFGNDGAGRFTELREGLERFLEDVEVTRGLALFDVDEDGDLDLIVTNTAGPVRLYENRMPKRGSWLMVDLREGKRGCPPVGARVVVETGGRRFRQSVVTAASYQTSWVTPLHFGLGEVASYDAIVVTWPDGAVERFPGGSTNRRILLRRGEG